MSVTAAQGFLAGGVAAGIKESGEPDLALVVNRGPSRAAAGVFTANRVQAAPVRWSRRRLADGQLSAVVLNSGGANACTGQKCALHGEDPNWGRVLSAIGTKSAVFDPDRLDVAVNGVWVCRDGAAGESRDKVDLSGRQVTVTIDLRSGDASASLWTNDLTAEYVHENSAYSS